MPLNSPITNWRDKTVWMVGASTGIGRATASRLHTLGARVIVSARSADALHSFVAEHPGAIALPLDVTDRNAVAVASAAKRAAAPAAGSAKAATAAAVAAVAGRATSVRPCLKPAVEALS